MKLFILIVVVVMANGKPATNSTIVEQCPNTLSVKEFFDDKQASGEILGWHAICVEAPVKRKEST